MKISVVVCPGPNKAECEDTALVGAALINNAVGVYEADLPVTICVADGVGGNPGGREAGEFILAGISADMLPAEETAVYEHLQELNRQLIGFAAGKAFKRQMATVFTGLFLTHESIILAHIGNTRLYVMQGGYLKKITEDQTTYQWLVSAGNDKAAAQCNKNEITGCLGGGDEKYALRLEVKRIFEKGMPDTLLLTSDGIHDYIDIDSLEELLAAPDDKSDLEIAGAIVSRASANGSTDDKTIIIVRTESLLHKE